MRLSKLFSEIVDPKIEPSVLFGWVYKVNSKKKADGRFFTATNSALYLSTTTLLRSLRISRVYSWIDLLSISITAQNHVVFTFNVTINPSVEIFFKDNDRFMDPVFAYLRSFLPESHKAYKTIPEVSGSYTFLENEQFLYMFVSACHSEHVQVDENLCNSLRKSLKNGNSITIDRKEQNETTIRLLIRALAYAKGISDVRMGGSMFPSLWSGASSILFSNTELESLSVFDYGNPHQFELFLDSFGCSSVGSIEFNKVLFNTEMSNSLVNSIPESSITEIYLSDCHFSECLHESMVNSPEKMKSLNTLAICNDSLANSSTFIPSIVRFLSITDISTLILVSCEIEIGALLNHISLNNLQIVKMDLSKNYCSSNFQGKVAFPITLTSLILESIEWKGNSLLTFLSTTTYNTVISLYLSRANLTEDSWNNLDKELHRSPPCPMITKFKWDDNYLTPSILAFFHKFQSLEELYLSRCTLNPESAEQILNSYVSLVAKSKLTSIHTKRTFKSLKTKFIEQLKWTLIEHQTISSLDIGENSIGDSGLSILLEIVSSNENICNLAFDKSELSQPTRLIEFITQISKFDHIKHIVKPRHDIAKLIEIHGKKTGKEIKVTWSRLITNSKKDTKDIEESDDTTFSSIRMTDNTTTDHYITTQLQASWEIYIDCPFSDSYKEWNALREKYTLFRILNIPKLEQKDPSDLIQFD